MELFGNETKVKDIIHAIETDCAKLSTSTAQKICDALGVGATDLMEQIDKGLLQLAWDAPAVCAALGECEVPCCESPTKPEQIHLGFSASGGITVSWATLEQTPSVLRWGLQKNQLSSTTSGNSSTYTKFGWRGHLHWATMTGLLPSETYYYQIGTGNQSNLSPIISFKTLARDIGMSQPLRVASVGDMGYGANSDTTIRSLAKMVESGAIDFVIHNGDIGYADGDQSHWDVFMRKIEPIASRVPYMVSPGNHEFYFNFTAFKRRFQMPL